MTLVEMQEIGPCEGTCTGKFYLSNALADNSVRHCRKFLLEFVEKLHYEYI